jgi:hypothetical protein
MTTRIPGAGSNIVDVATTQAINTPKYPVAARLSILSLHKKAAVITNATTVKQHTLCITCVFLFCSKGITPHQSVLTIAVQALPQENPKGNQSKIVENYLV